MIYELLTIPVLPQLVSHNLRVPLNSRLDWIGCKSWTSILYWIGLDP